MMLTAALERHLPLTERGILAVSGGADSMALACGVTELPSAGLLIAHFNHGWRGSESDADEAFVRDWVASLEREEITFASSQATIEQSLQQSEAHARSLRYRWLMQVAQQHGARWIATAHTADDQAETVLQRLLRGTGLTGLSGIPAARLLGEHLQLIRPMLSISREQVLEYLDERGQTYRTDQSNDNPRYERARIRGQLMPLLQEFNPDIRAALGRLATQAHEWQTDAHEYAVHLLNQVDQGMQEGWITLDRVRLQLVSRSWVREMFRHLWQREGWPLGRMGMPEWNRLADLVWGEPAQSQFPGSVRVRSRLRTMRLRQESDLSKT